MIASGIIIIIINLIIFALSAPLLVGLLHWSQARLQLRVGPTPLQPYRDLMKLWSITPRTLKVPSWVFDLAPYVSALCYLIAGAMLPMVVFARPSAIGQTGMTSIDDLIVLIYLLGFAKFAAALGAMDSGAPFAHMGVSRTMLLHIALELGLILSLAALGVYWHTTNITAIVSGMQSLGIQGIIHSPALLAIALSLLILGLAEAGRLPFDNPETRLELTMTEHSMTIEYSGRHYAAVQAAEAFKLLTLIILFTDFYVPGLVAPIPSPILPVLFALACYPAKLLICAIMLAIWELAHGHYRFPAGLWPMLSASGLAVFAIALSIGA